MDNPETLRAIVQTHTVRYESWPHWDMYGGQLVMNGFDIELHATHDHGKTYFSPGCKLCQQTYADLKKVAEAILPGNERPSAYVIECFDQSLHAEGKGPLEVVLVLHIYHKHDYFSPIDPCEERCLTEMEGKLKELGASGRRRRN